MAIYKCKSYGICSLAQQNKDIDIEAGKAAICPECGESLEENNDILADLDIPQQAQSSSSPVLKIVIIIVAVIALGGGGAYFFMSKKSSDTTRTYKKTAAKSEVNRAIDLVNISVSLMKKKKYQLASEKLQEARMLAPDLPLIYYNIAVLDLKRKDIQGAIKNFETCLLKDKAFLATARKDKDFEPLWENGQFKALENRFK